MVYSDTEAVACIIGHLEPPATINPQHRDYMGHGVGEYVSIDWRKDVLQVWSCTEDGKNYNVSEYRSGDRVVLNSFPALVISVEQMILKK